MEFRLLMMHELVEGEFRYRHTNWSDERYLDILACLTGLLGMEQKDKKAYLDELRGLQNRISNPVDPYSFVHAEVEAKKQQVAQQRKQTDEKRAEYLTAITEQKKGFHSLEEVYAALRDINNKLAGVAPAPEGAATTKQE